MADVPDWNTLTIVAGAASASAVVGYAVSQRISSQGREFSDALSKQGTEFTAALTKLSIEFSHALNTLGHKFAETLADHKDADQEKFHDHATRISMIELRLTGVTHSGKNPDKIDSKETSRR